ncbi:uncharacterized protein [Nicotiana tomentosiformis]|uniref:uncharacterized protein isoform X1 n=1 Tax=Nicotiana tomentosiformis TaxID=4098 RepID=UPI00051ACDC2|nr:uncharacterized protein LOC104105137 isoform X1 [Nicotiana tomentosiformis]
MPLWSPLGVPATSVNQAVLLQGFPPLNTSALHLGGALVDVHSKETSMLLSHGRCERLASVGSRRVEVGLTSLGESLLGGTWRSWSRLRTCPWTGGCEGFACILELLAAPFYILSQNLLLLKSRLIVETAATLSHCLTIYFLFVKLPDMVFGFICQRYFISTSFHLKELVSKALPVC